MNMTSLTLLWLAGYSNVTSIVVIILCFLAMTIFIGFVSTNWDYSERRSTAAGVEERNMVQVCNPFFVKLGQTGKKLTDGICVHVSSLCPSKLFVLWGVEINPLHDFILKPGRHVREALEDVQAQDYQELGALHYDTLQFPEPGDHEVNLPCPVSINGDTLGTMPRKRYPVTIFSLLSESCDATSHASEKLNGCVDKQSIIGLISVIHLQDEIVVQPSHIIGQYVKTSGVQLYSLQPLFLSSAFDGCHGNQNETLNRKNRRDETVTRQGSPTDETATRQGSPADATATRQGSPADATATRQGSPADATATRQGSPADSTRQGSPADATATRQGSPADATATWQGSPADATATRQGSPADATVTRQGSPADATATRQGSPADATATRQGSPAEKDHSSSNNPHKDLNPADVAPKLGDTADSTDNGPPKLGDTADSTDNGPPKLGDTADSTDNGPPKLGDTADSTDNGPSQKRSLQYSSPLDAAEPAIRRRNSNSSCESVVTSANGQDISELCPCGDREENPPHGCEGGKVTQPECVVCQTRRVMCALLPCRHACVCLGCFKLLDRCPMCRGMLESYFVLGGEDAQEVEGESTLHDLQHQAVNEHFTQVWERLNHRLNAFFGMR